MPIKSKGAPASKKTTLPQIKSIGRHDPSATAGPRFDLQPQADVGKEAADILRQNVIQKKAEYAAEMVMYRSQTLVEELNKGLTGKDIKGLAPISKISLAGLALVEVADIAWQTAGPLVTGGLSLIEKVATAAVKKGAKTGAKAAIAGREIQTESPPPVTTSGKISAQVKALTPAGNIQTLGNLWEHRRDRFGKSAVFRPLDEVRKQLSASRKRLRGLLKSNRESNLLDERHLGFLMAARDALQEADSWLTKYEERSKEALQSNLMSERQTKLPPLAPRHTGAPTYQRARKNKPAQTTSFPPITR